MEVVTMELGEALDGYYVGRYMWIVSTWLLTMIS
jgi:hypothetical protein